MWITLEITKEQVKLLEEVLTSYWDRGPTGIGWQSDELIELTESIVNIISAESSER